MLTADRLIRSVVLFVTSGLRCLLAVSIQLVSSSFCFYILVPALSTLIAGCVSHSFLKKFGQVSAYRTVHLVFIVHGWFPWF
jgi:hypothetical protein